MQTQISIRGFVVGPIWWPAGAECFKPFTYDLTREDKRFVSACLSEMVASESPERLRGTLRDHVLAITNDGDFQSCSIACAELTIETRKPGRTRSRSWPLERFPSIADCLHADPDWCPDYGEE